MKLRASSRIGASRFLRRALAALAFTAAGAASAQEPLRVLSVGNSVTYGRAPAITPNPWGGLPGIFKTLVEHAQVATDVRM
jgi:hypothetical protein